MPLTVYDRYQLMGGCFNPNPEENRAFAPHLGLPEDRIYDSVDQLIEAENSRPINERMEVVSVLTPNFLHFLNGQKLLENNFNVICEKPLTNNL